MAERSFAKEVQKLKIGEGETFSGEGILALTKALLEAAAKGIETFCITVDRSGHDYLKRMCPDARYLVIDEIEALPDALTKVYATLTSS